MRDENFQGNRVHALWGHEYDSKLILSWYGTIHCLISVKANSGLDVLNAMNDSMHCFLKNDGLGSKPYQNVQDGHGNPSVFICLFLSVFISFVIPV